MAGVPAGAGALVGKRLGSYEIVALLALGGTAEIYLARIVGAAGFEKYVVVKCLHDHLAEDREFVQMFLDEARLGAQFDHSNIVQTLGLGEQDGRYYLVMEFIAGMSLALLARRAVERVPGGRIPVSLVLGIAAQACAGLHYAHQKESGGKPLNLVHRDISPQNLVITFEGDVRIVDFGIAKAEDRETATRSGTIKGKFAYMSPEQCHAKEIDRRTDVFALGVVVHELLTGRRLFKRSSTYETYQAILECKVPAPSAVNHELDPALDAVVMKALTRGVNERYPHAEAFGEAITRYLHSRGKFAGSSDIATFINQHFMPEIDDHADRMRELLEGRPAQPTGWDEPDAAQESEAAVELSQFELIGDMPPDDDEPDPDDLPVDATRIEMNPMALLDSLDVPRGADGGSAVPPPIAAARTAPVVMAPPAPVAPPVPAAAPKPAAASVRPQFGSKGSTSSIFGAVAPTPAAQPPPPSSKPPPPIPAPTPGKSIFDAQTGSGKLPPLRRATVPGSLSAADETRPAVPTLGSLPPPPGFGEAPPSSRPPPLAAPPPGFASTPPPLGAPPPGVQRSLAPPSLGTAGPLGGPPPALGSQPPARSRAQTQPSPIVGGPAASPSRGFGPANAAGLSTVIAPDPTPPPAQPRGFAAPPEARTMALSALVVEDDDPVPTAKPVPTPPPSASFRGLPASFEAVLGDDLGPDDREHIARGATVPAMDVVAPELQAGRGPADSPTYRAPFVDPLKPIVSLTPLPMLSAPFPSGEVRSLQPQPFPSGELLVPAHGTPPGTVSSSHDSLPAHLISLPPSNAYPRYDGSYPIPRLQRSFPVWILPVAISVVAMLVIGIVAAVAG